MHRIALFFASAVLLAAQAVSNHYIVEFNTEPAVSTAVAKRARFSLADAQVVARRAEIQTEHTAAEATIRGLGGAVTHHFDTLLNGMAVTMNAQAADRLRQMPGVRGVYPVNRHRKLMDQAIQVHRIAQAWQTMAGGSANAGAGVRIGIFDCGVDNTHPMFSGFSTPPPAGFPVTSGSATAANTNNKVIVARVYSDLAGGLDNSQTDANDYCQHGTDIAAIAAGLSVDPGAAKMVGPVSGVAPGAWIGNYKVATDFGQSDDVTFQTALQDALADGMQVVNYSYGGPVAYLSDETGANQRAIANANSAGMLVVVASGDSGGLGTVGSPGVVPAAITVGAIPNQRWFWFSAIVGGQPFYAIPSGDSIGIQTGDTTGAAVDVSTLTSDTAGLACNALPNGSLSNGVALIQRGTCSFATKLANALKAGATGAIIYDNQAETLFDYTLSGVDVSLLQLGLDGPPVDSAGNSRVFTWTSGGSSLPAVFVSQSDGQSIQKLIAASPGVQIDLDFDGKTPLPYPSNVVSDFSSAGPTPSANIKPDIVAVGDWLVTAETTQYETPGCPTPYALDLNNACYPPFTILDSPWVLDFEFSFGYGQIFDAAAGTSFSAPMVTGAIAALMAAKPGLSAAQYRSLITNSAPEFDQYPTNAIAPPQLAGAGKLDLLGALQAGITASPSLLNFVPHTSTTGGSSSSVITAAPVAASVPRVADAATGVSQSVTLTNVGSASDTFTVSLSSLDNIAVPAVDSPTFSLAPGASKTLSVSIPGSASLASGQYHGFLLVNGTQGQTPLRVPYWYGVIGSNVQNFNLLGAPSFDPPACTDVIDFRTMDAIGLPLDPGGSLSVTTTSPRASVGKVSPIGTVPGSFEVQITTGRPDANGNNVFTITAGGATTTVVVSIDTSGQTSCGGN